MNRFVESGNGTITDNQTGLMMTAASRPTRLICPDADLVFPSLSGGPALYETDRKRLHRICVRAGVEPVSFHSIRHWAGLQATAAGKSRKAVADFLGHTSTAVTERYMHALRPEIWDVARRLEEALDLRAEATTEVVSR